MWNKRVYKKAFLFKEIFHYLRLSLVKHKQGVADNFKQINTSNSISSFRLKTSFAVLGSHV